MFDVFDVLMEIAPTNKPRRPGFTRTTALSTGPRKFSMVCWALHPQASLRDPDSLGRRRYRLTRGNFQWFVGNNIPEQAKKSRSHISQLWFHGSTAWNYYVLISYFDACENQLQYGLTVYGSQNTVRPQSETDIEGGTAWKRKF